MHDLVIVCILYSTYTSCAALYATLYTNHNTSSIQFYIPYIYYIHYYTILCIHVRIQVAANFIC